MKFTIYITEIFRPDEETVGHCQLNLLGGYIYLFHIQVTQFCTVSYQLLTILPVGQLIIHIFFTGVRKCILLIALKVIDDVIRQAAVTEAWQVPAEMPPVLRGERVQ